MVINTQYTLTEIVKAFLEPKSPTHRQYEALRAYFVDGLPSAEVADRFGYSPGSFRVLCSKFRKDPERVFFVSPARGSRAAPKTDPWRDQVITLRKQNLSIKDIQRALHRDGKKLSTGAIAKILRQEGFAKLPRRRDEDRPAEARPSAAEVADRRQLDLTPRRLRTRFGGLFLFLPWLTRIGLDTLLEQAGFPGTKMIPAAHAVRALLALKLFGNARHSHVMSHVFDPGLALFAGLNVIPKRAFLTEYSCRIEPAAHRRLMPLWFDATARLGLERGVSFDLDFHTIPFHGEDALVEKHYVSKRSRRQKGMLAFLAQDGEERVFCYANADLRKAEQNDEILRFVAFWKQRTGSLPQELIFDSKLTTYENLDHLNAMGIRFITLRRRSAKITEQARALPADAWRRIRLDNVTRAYRTPRILDRKISLKGYRGQLRQLTILDLGHDQPTLLITNHMRKAAAKLIERYAQRMLIENRIADGIDFFHMDALSSAVPMKVNCDLQLTLMASSLYRLFASRIENGYENATSRHIFRDFIDACADIEISKDTIHIRFQKRAHNPLLIAAGFHQTDIQIPWLAEKRMRVTFG
jgi:hypothetical protein